MRCACCNRRFHSKTSYELYLKRKAIHEQLRLEVYGTDADPGLTKRERHMLDSQQHRMGQA